MEVIKCTCLWGKSVEDAQGVTGLNKPSLTIPNSKNFIFRFSLVLLITNKVDLPFVKSMYYRIDPKKVIYDSKLYCKGGK